MNTRAQIEEVIADYKKTLDSLNDQQHEIRHRLLELEDEIKALPQQPKSLFKVLPFTSTSYSFGSNESWNNFATCEEAERHQGAIRLLYTLRHSHGSEKPQQGKEQWVLYAEFNQDHDRLRVIPLLNSIKTGLLSPTFDTQENALNAIRDCKDNRILDMFRVFAGEPPAPLDTSKFIF